MPVDQLDGNISDAYPIVRDQIGDRSDIYKATELDQEARIVYELGHAAHDGIMRKLTDSERTISQPVMNAGKCAMEFLRAWDTATRCYGL
jgi:hypothetical protein